MDKNIVRDIGQKEGCGNVMKICTFFGHRDCSYAIKEKLKKEIRNLIKNESVKKFYFGNQGNFDIIVLNVIKELKEEYPDISYNIVLAYIPTSNSSADHAYSFLPDGIEKIPKRFAISYRNKWLVNKSDFVITYVVKPCGGAAKFMEYAIKKKKKVINLFESIP